MSFLHKELVLIVDYMRRRLPSSSLILSLPLLLLLLSTASSVAKAFTQPIVGSTSRTLAKSSSNENENDENDDAPTNNKRRKTIFGGATAAGLASLFGSNNKSISSNVANAATTIGEEKPLADFPMKRLKLPRGGLGREYVIIQVYIGNDGPFDFMVDSGLTTEMITPRKFVCCFVVKYVEEEVVVCIEAFLQN